MQNQDGSSRREVYKCHPMPAVSDAPFIGLGKAVVEGSFPHTS